MTWKKAFALAVGSAQATCSLNSDNSACVSPTTSQCVSTCSLYPSSTSCAGAPAGANCAWTAEMNNGVDLGNCTGGNSCSGSTESNCISPVCTWQTNPCKLLVCIRPLSGDDCGPAATASQCASLGSGCRFQNACSPSTTCRMPNTESECIATAGCFWMVAVATLQGQAGNSVGCSPCFDDPQDQENNYLAAKATLGQKCGLTLTDEGTSVTLSYSFLSATPASTGCSGGIATPLKGITCSTAHSLGVSFGLSLVISLLYL